MFRGDVGSLDASRWLEGEAKKKTCCEPIKSWPWNSPMARHDCFHKTRFLVFKKTIFSRELANPLLKLLRANTVWPAGNGEVEDRLGGPAAHTVATLLIDAGGSGPSSPHRCHPCCCGRQRAGGTCSAQRAGFAGLWWMCIGSGVVCSDFGFNTVAGPSNGCPMDYPTLIQHLDPMGVQWTTLHYLGISVGHPLDGPGVFSW